MNHTYPAGDRDSDPGSRYGTCLREVEHYDCDCHHCGDTGICDPNKATSQEYCDCTLGRYLERAEREED